MAEIKIQHCPSDHGREIFIWQADESLPELEEMFLREFSETEQTKLPTQPKRRTEVIVEMLLIGRHSDGKLSHDKDGAPYLSGSVRQISISHCKDLVCICLSDDSIGVDIERWSSRAWKIKQRFLSPDELRFVPESGGENTAMLLWCAKEAAFKYFREPDTAVTQIRLSDFARNISDSNKFTVTATSTKGRKVKICMKAYDDFAFAISQ